MSELKKEFKREGFHNYLTIEKQDNLKKFEVEMLLNNNISSLLPIEERSMDGEEYFYYEISSKQSLKVIAEQILLSYKQVSKLVENIMNSIYELKQYLLNSDSILLRVEDIYIELPTYKVYFCYVCGYEENIKENFKRLIEYLMNKINHKEEKTVIFTYGIYKFMQQENYNIEEIRLYVEENKLKSNQSYIEQNDGENNSDEEIQIWKDIVEEDIQENQIKELKKISVKEKLYKKDKVFTYIICGIFTIFSAYFTYKLFSGNLLKSQMIYLIISIILLGISLIYLTILMKKETKENIEAAINDWDEGMEIQTSIKEKAISVSHQIKEIEEDNEETVLLTNDIIINLNPRLKNKNTDEEVELRHFPFVIGSFSEVNDYSIKNKVISKIHAKFMKEGKDYYVVDLNSKNGTYVNQKVVFPNALVKLEHGDEIKFADVNYYFLYE